ncbi:hypothetical protein P43SY_006220 [Pythium insidiosum]|uniref:cysteine--tRNA ligase n=1 Tax=Pythium insidiosum TaxID=114742 RepID=A0AAD5Q7Y2_PYTIN|nr:hypothetical protein P43SY_006220 [Pythium insidiosum]
MWPRRSMPRLLNGAAPPPRRLHLQRATPLRLSRALSSAAPSRELRVWNSLTQTTEPLPDADAVTPHVLRWYSCGPTVYDRAHLGHARAYVSQDILRRVLERRLGRHIFLVMGVTDVDDKIIARARERGLRFDELARAEEDAFFRDLARLHVLPPTAVTRVSEHMEDIVQYVATIADQGFAYEAPDGTGVYFDTRRLGPQYGRLDPARTHAEQPAQEGETEVETEEDAGSKRDRRDFALWKAAKTPAEPSWPSPWGPGRPGWHIECSAMTHRVLGARLDVHTGGIDLKFPHHNNEIAQCEAHNGLTPGHACTDHGHDHGEWCRHFIHFGHLYIRGLKMSKSLKNFISVQDFLEKHSADQFRVFCLQHKYRANIHYADDRMRDAVVVTDRVRNFLRTVVTFLRHPDGSSSTPVSKRCDRDELELLATLFATRVAFDAALCDDFDTPTALRHVMELLARANEYLVRQRSSTSSSGAPQEPVLAVATFVLDVLDLLTEEERRAALVETPGATPEAKPEAVNEVEPKATDVTALKLQEYEALMQITPEQLFRVVDEYVAVGYSQFDGEGVPTHDASGQELSKSQRKKLLKKRDKHSKAYSAYWAKKNKERSATP